MAVVLAQRDQQAGAPVQADWKIVERGWHAHVLGEAEHKFKSALEAIKKLRVRRQPIKYLPEISTISAMVLNSTRTRHITVWEQQHCCQTCMTCQFGK